ncbi:MAG: aldo/keto reductase [Bryobacteraceae bacterium]
MNYRTLGKTGLSVSQIGFGASPLGDVFGKADPSEATRAVHRAIDVGINLFDVSPYYGHTLAEERLGKALTGRREKVLLATKCGRYGAESFDFSATRIRRSIDESLTRLQTDYVDLFLAHDIEFGNVEQIISETVPALREIQQSGKARYIGVTGYPLQMLKSVAERERIDVILSYCRYNLLVTDLDADLAPSAKSRKIGLINASPLHMGLLSGSPIPTWHPAPASVRRAAADIIDFCRKHKLDPAVLALRFCIEHPYVASTLVGMSTREQVESNLKALTFEIEPALLHQIQEIAAPAKDIVWPSGSPENQDQTGTHPPQKFR